MALQVFTMRSQLGPSIMLGSYWTSSRSGRVGTVPGAGRTGSTAGGPFRQKVPAGNTAGKPPGNKIAGSQTHVAGGSTLHSTFRLSI